MEEKQSDIQENQTALSSKQKVSPSSGESVDKEGDWHCDGMSIRTKILSLLTAALFLFGFVSAAISYSIYEECDSATDRSGIYRSTNGFCNGSWDVIAGLKNRFAREKADALGMLTGITVKL